MLPAPLISPWWFLLMPVCITLALYGLAWLHERWLQSRAPQRPQRSRYLPPTVYRFPQHGPKLSRALRKPRGWK